VAKTRFQPPRFGSTSQNVWLDGLENMGGQFWPPEPEEEDMPEVGAKYPMMLYEGSREVIVYDDEEYEKALKHGFAEHPSKPQGTSPPDGTEPPDEEKPPAKLPPIVKDVPYLSQKGDLLTCTMGNWTGEPTSYKYQYRRDGETTIGTGSNEYVITPTDVGSRIDCVVEASNAVGKTSSTSNAVVVTEPGQPEQQPEKLSQQAPAQQRATVSVQRTVTVTPPATATKVTAAAPPPPKASAPTSPATRTVPPPVSAPPAPRQETQTTKPVAKPAVPPKK